MSVINEAIQRAAAEQKEKKVIPVPRATAPYSKASIALFAVLFVLLAIVGYRVAVETRARQASEKALAAQFQDLEQRHLDLVSRIYQSDAHLDTRLQLEIFDLKSDLRKLALRVDAMDPEELQTLKADTQLFRDEVKDEIRILSKRFHNNEREHSILNDRIEALNSRLSS
jgi:hypothetical protein